MAKVWDKDEDLYLLANFGKHEPQLIARVLERSETALRKRYYLISKQATSQSKAEPELEFFLERSNRSIPRNLKKRTGPVLERTSKLSSWSGRGNAYAHTKTGFRSDLGLSCRSGWEANIMRVLVSYDIPFEYEPSIFYYPIKRGNRAYTPDLYLPSSNEWIEIKGYLDKNSEIKMKRFKKYYPEDFENLTMIIGKSSKRAREFCGELKVPIVLFYEECSRVFKSRIETWEGR